MRRLRLIGIVSVLTLMLTGAYVLGDRHALQTTKTLAADDCQTFMQTGHQVCGSFLQYWQNNGGLAQQGYPISDPFMETSATDGKTYQVQYFERAVFELHPELQAPNNVLLTLLGSEKFKTKYGGKQPNGTVAPMTTAAPSSATTAVPTVTIAPTKSMATLSNRVSGMSLAITYNGIKDPAPTDSFLKPDNAANRCVALDLTFENLLSEPTSFNPAYAGLRTSDDRTYDRTYTCSNITPVRSATMINGGDKLRTYMLFEIPKGTVVSAFTYSDFGSNVLTLKI